MHNCIVGLVSRSQPRYVPILLLIILCSVLQMERQHDADEDYMQRATLADAQEEGCSAVEFGMMQQG